jgi:hypothetical protein
VLAVLGLGALLALSAVAAGLWGGVRERLAVVIFTLAGAGWLLMPANPRVGPALGLTIIFDTAALVLLGRMAWKSPREWPVWTMAPQAVAVAASAAFALQADVDAQTYLRALLLTRYGAVLLLLIGMWRRPKAQP